MSVVDRKRTGGVPMDVIDAFDSLTSLFGGNRFVGRREYQNPPRLLPGIQSNRFSVHYDTLSRNGDELNLRAEGEFEIIGGEVAISPDDSSKYLAVIYAHMSSNLHSPIVAFYATNDTNYRTDSNRIRWNI